MPKRLAIVWTFVLGALFATVLTTEGPRLDRDGEASWLRWGVPALWLIGIGLLLLVGRRRR